MECLEYPTKIQIDVSSHQLTNLLSKQENTEDKQHNLQYLKNIKRNIQKPDNDKIKIDVSKTQYPLIKQVALNHSGWKIWSKQSAKEEVNIFWNDTYVTQELVRKLKPYQKTNHFPCSHELGKKNYLAQNLKKLKKMLPEQYNFYPETFNLPEQYQKLKQFESKQKSAWYIVKPIANSQGRGIYLTQKLAQSKQQMVVQQYIHKPLIIQNYKFDLRIYVLIKSVTPLKIFIFNQGLARFATQDYSQPNESNQNNFKMHLTNYAINKLNPVYIFNKDQKQDYIGHKRSISSIMQTIQKLGCDVKKLQLKIDQIIVKTILSAHAKIADSYKNCRNIEDQPISLCFQILGFDILINQNFQPFLLQVNHTPSFMTQTPLDTVIKKCLILDTFNLIKIDPKQKINYFKFKQNQFQVQSKKKKNFTNRQKLVQEQQFQNENLGGFRKIYPIMIQPENYFKGLFYLNRQTSQQQLLYIEQSLWILYQKYNRIIIKMTDKGKKKKVEISIQERIQRVVGAYTRQMLPYETNKAKQLERQEQKRKKIAQSYHMFINKNYQNRKSLQVTVHQLDKNQQLEKIYRMDKSRSNNNSDLCLNSELSLVNREAKAIQKHIFNEKKLISPVKLKNIQIDFHSENNPKGKYPLINHQTQSQFKQKSIKQQELVILFSPPHIRHHEVLKLRGTNKSKSVPSRPAQPEKPTTSIEIASRINKIVIPTIKLQKLKYTEKARSVDSQAQNRYVDTEHVKLVKKHEQIKSVKYDQSVLCQPYSKQQNLTEYRSKKYNQKQLHSAGFYSRKTSQNMKKIQIQDNKSFNFSSFNGFLSFNC